MFVVLLQIVVGIFCISRPFNIWYIIIGWLIKGAEPREGALKVFRFIGVLMIINAFLLFTRFTFHPI
jgi:hypothetical protein